MYCRLLVGENYRDWHIRQSKAFYTYSHLITGYDGDYENHIVQSWRIQEFHANFKFQFIFEDLNTQVLNKKILAVSQKQPSPLNSYFT
ncbi:hypothetical protein pb186bvf_011982 [Paramecium bursaria]